MSNKTTPIKDPFTSNQTTEKRDPKKFLRRSTPRYTLKNRGDSWRPDGNGFGSSRVEKPDPQDYLRRGDGQKEYSHPSSDYSGSDPNLSFEDIYAKKDTGIFSYDNRNIGGKRRTYRKRHIKRSNRRRRRR